MLANAGAVLFAMGVALLTGSLSLGAPQLNRCGKWLAWCGGSALFYLYIYQRIPMLLGAHWEMNRSMGTMYCAMCVGLTMLIAWLVLYAGRVIKGRVSS